MEIAIPGVTREWLERFLAIEPPAYKTEDGVSLVTELHVEYDICSMSVVAVLTVWHPDTGNGAAWTAFFDPAKVAPERAVEVLKDMASDCTDGSVMIMSRLPVVKGFA